MITGRWFDADAEQTLGGLSVAAVRVYHVVFLRVDFGQEAAPAGETGRGTTAVIASAKANANRICSYFGPCD